MDHSFSEKISNALWNNALTNMALVSNNITNRPNEAVKNLFTCIELTLKARLCLYDWKLICTKTVSEEEFEEGDFFSIKYHEACSLLRNELGYNNQYCSEFDSLRKIRNKIIHFHNSKSIYDEHNARIVVYEAWKKLYEMLNENFWEELMKYSESSVEPQNKYINRLILPYLEKKA